MFKKYEMLNFVMKLKLKTTNEPIIESSYDLRMKFCSSDGLIFGLRLIQV
jgi:hypothetical protein